MRSVMIAAVAAAAGLAQAQIDFVGPRDSASLIGMYDGRVNERVVYVKFRDDAPLRAGQGELRSLAGEARGAENARGDGQAAALDALRALGTWQRHHHISDDDLERQRQVAQQTLARALPDLRQESLLTLRDGLKVADALDQLNAMGVVDIALPHPLPAAPPLPPNYVASQGYLNASTVGVGSNQIWTWPGGRGQDIRVCDVEYGFNSLHFDLPAITTVGPAPVNPFTPDHGTAVLGQMLSRDNGWGTTGGVPNASGYFSAANTAGGYNVAAAITVATNALRAGDAILIEQQIWEPDGNYVPSEWVLGVYNATVQAVGNGRIVVAAAGNGNSNLDGAQFNTGHRPFQAATLSGSILVGAGAAPASFGGSTTDRSRLTFSTYGSAVAVQGWGERVTTTSYGNLYSTEGTNYWYTNSFSGTSSASPIVTNAVVGLQGVYKAVTGQVLTPAQVRSALRLTGAPQQAGTNPVSQNIGPRPNVAAAIASVFGNNDCNANQRPDRVDIAGGWSADTNGNLVPDECDGPSCDSIDFNNDGSSFDPTDIDAFLSVFSEGPCVPIGGACNDVDFNNDASLFDPCDIDSFLLVFSEGPCTPCGT